MKNAKLYIKYLLCLFAVICMAIPSLFADNDLNDLVVERKNVQKQLDALNKNEKTFKNKTSLAEYQSLLKRLLDLDEQIILAANFSVNTLQHERDEAVKKAANPKTIIKSIPFKVTGNNDSLSNALTSLQFQNSNFNNLIKAKDDAMMRFAIKVDSLATLNKKVNSQFEALETDNKNLGEKNLILMIFNSLVVIALIMSLFFLIRRPAAKKLLFNEPKPVGHVPTVKEIPPVAAAPVVTIPVAKTPVPEPEKIIKKAPEPAKPEPVFKVSSDGILSASHDSLDFKLDQIEKLARLKEKGYLTDEEFNTQKKQILGS